MPHNEHSIPEGDKRRGMLYVDLVVLGGLSICRMCSAAEQELIDHPTCEQFRAHLEKEKANA